MENFSSQPVSKPSLDASTRDRLAPATSTPVSPIQVASEGFFQRNRWFFLLLVLGLVVIGLLAIFIFRKPQATSQPKVDLSIIAPSQVPSSADAGVQIVLKNNETSALSSAELELIYPEGVTFESANPSPENLSGTLYKINQIQPGANPAIIVKLRFEGAVGSTRTVQARLKYSIAGLSAEFAKQAEAQVQLVAAGVSVDIQGPQTATNAQPVSYTLHYANQSSQNFEHVRIKLVTPASFQFAESTPVPTQGFDTWDVGGVAANASGDIVVSGAFGSAAPGQSVPLTAQLLVPDKNGGFYTQAEGRFVTAIATQPLMVMQSLRSAAEAGPLVAAPGDTLQYRITYQNNATVAARGVRIIFSVDSTTADLATLQAEGATISGNTVTWSAASSPDLEVLNPNESGSVAVSMRIKNPPVSDRTINPSLATSLKIKADEYDTFLPGNKLQVQIATKFGLEGTATYLDGSKPPKVGQATRYTVSLALKNSTSNVLNGSLVLYVATGNNSFDKASVTPAEANNVTYDASTGKLVWKLDTVRAHTGDFSPPRVLQFTLRVVPATAQVGKPIFLVKNVQFTGKDSNTSQDVTAHLTELVSTDGSSGFDGVVTQ